MLRQQYQEAVLPLVKRGVAEADLEEAMGPALVELHEQLAAYVAAVVVSLFDGDALATLSASLTPFQQLTDERFVHRALLRQINYLGDVGAHLQDSDYNVAWELFDLKWHNREVPTGFGLRLTMYLPQPVAAVKYAPLSVPPTLIPAHFSESAGDPPSFLLARWLHTNLGSGTCLSPPSAILDRSNLHWEVLQQGRIASPRFDSR